MEADFVTKSVLLLCLLFIEISCRITLKLHSAGKNTFFLFKLDESKQNLNIPFDIDSKQIIEK